MNVIDLLFKRRQGEDGELLLEDILDGANDLVDACEYWDVHGLTLPVDLGDGTQFLVQVTRVAAPNDGGAA